MTEIKNQKIKDILRQGSEQDVIDYLVKITSELYKINDKIIYDRDVINGVDYKYCLSKCIDGICNELKKITKSDNLDIFDISLHSRNIFEIFLMFNLIYKNPEKAKEFVGQIYGDVITIYEGILKNSEENKESIKYIDLVRQKIKKIESIYQKNNLELQFKNWNMKEVASETGFLDHYETLYKFYSKLVHPSPMKLCIGIDKEFGEETVRNIFMTYIQLQCLHIQSLSHELVLLDSSHTKIH